MPNSSPTGSSIPAISVKARLLLFLAPFLLLIFLEILLRVSGLFALPPLFIETDYGGERVYQINTTVAERYFNPEKMTVPGLYPEKFRIDKTDKTYRIFCLGGSTTAGFPFDAQVPFPHQLRFMLAQKYPDYDIEVINIGISAVNSFTVLDLMPEVLEKDPDLLIIYMGHNEFYGVYGSGSTQSVGNQGWFVRTYLELRSYRVVEMFRRALLSFSGDTDAPPTDQSLMESLSADKSISLDSPKYQQTRQNYQDNLDRILALAGQQNVPVFLSSLTSNLLDQPPLEQTEGGKEANRLFKSAGSKFITGDTLQARNLFIQAKDHDGIRFRATAEWNSVLSEAAEKQQVIFIDIENAFAQKSTAGIPGYDLFCDHLHPTPDGYYLMAKEYFREIENQQFLSEGNTAFKPAGSPYYVTPLDWEIGYLKIYQMLHRWPFPYKQVSFATYPAKTTPDARRIAGEFIFSHQNWEKAQYDMAKTYIATQNYGAAIRQYFAVHTYLPGSSLPFEKLATLYQQLGDLKNAIGNFQKALRRAPDNPGLLQLNYSKVLSKTGNHTEAINVIRKAMTSKGLSHRQSLEARYYLSSYLFNTAQYDAAQKELDKFLNIAPEHKQALELKERLKKYVTNQ
ncbi:MAG: GDSL-type esterase/lipase family protein [Calditrichota bacterium]